MDLVTDSYLLCRSSFEEENPKNAVGAKQNLLGLKGSKTSRG